MRQSACLGFGPIMVDNYATFFKLHAGGSAVGIYDDPDIKLSILVGWDRSFLSDAWPSGVQLVFFFCSGFQQVIRRPGIFIFGQLTESASFFIHHGGYHDLFVCP